jgi:hypothetical protein
MQRVWSTYLASQAGVQGSSATARASVSDWSNPPFDRTYVSFSQHSRWTELGTCEALLADNSRIFPKSLYHQSFSSPLHRLYSPFRYYIPTAHAPPGQLKAGAPKSSLCLQRLSSHRFTTCRFSLPRRTVQSLFIRQLPPHQILGCSPLQRPQEPWQSLSPRSQTWWRARSISQWRGSYARRR